MNVEQKDITPLVDLYFNKSSCASSVLFSHLHNGFDSLITHVIPDIVKSKDY